MKKIIIAGLASVLAVACVPLNLTASAEYSEYDNWFFTRKPYALESENFIYKRTRPMLQPTPESGIECNANFMITGVFCCCGDDGKTPAEGRIYTFIALDDPWMSDSVLYSSELSPYIENAHDLNIGDLLYIQKENIFVAEVFPSIVEIFDDETRNAEVNYIGNGTDIFGDEFMKVIRHTANYDAELNVGWCYDYYADISKIETIDVIHGDATEDEEVNILDVISINKSVLGREQLSSYARYVSDVDENGTVDSNDALNVLKYIVGLKENLEVEE